EGDPLQPRYLLCFTLLAVLYVVFNEDGVGWFPMAGMVSLMGLSAYGVGIAFSPFVWGGAYLMGLRTCVGFLTAGALLYLFAQGLPSPETAAPFMPTSARPHAFVWPGIMFLITSGMTALAMQWRMVVDAVRSLFSLSGGTDRDPIMPAAGTALFTIAAVAFVVVGLGIGFRIPILLVLTMTVIGGLVLGLIATRAAAQTYFNPARVMGVLLMGLNTLLGSSNAMTSLTGAGFIAGSGSQSGNLTGDMAYGFWYRVRSAWQFWTQGATLLTCTVVSALTFWLIRQNFTLAMDGGDLPAPVAKIWATMAMLFDPQSDLSLPPFAVESMWIAGIVGVAYALLESRASVRRFLPGSIGIGLGLILPIAYNLGFFAGGILMFVVIRRFLRVSDITCNTIAISCIVGEGIGGITQAVLKTVGVIHH
ncbi:MAG: OPT/YSL family transporter, partial [Candidatus Kerfeldbacteria bacterium]|nr:OPT/YSL family transporter [Candidatus Kerfeldbacteria bacterium]